MPGAVFQLHLKGDQNLFLTGNPEHNFIKQVYKRHVNFAIQKKTIEFKNQVDFGRRIDISIPREGDLLHKLYFQFSLPSLTKTSGVYAGWANSIGHVIIDTVELSIGGMVIDKHYGIFMEIWNELTRKSDFTNEHLMTGKYNHLDSLKFNAVSGSQYEVPLQFWFCNNIGSALPLLSLQFHPVKLSFQLRPFEECITYDGSTPPGDVSIKQASVLAEYIYLEDSERVKFIEKKHTYLISQVQSNLNESVKLNNGGLYKSVLNYNHPCSELLFVLSEESSQDNNDWFNFAQRNTDASVNTQSLLSSARLLIDGTERTHYLDEFTLRVTNNHRFHTNTPDNFIYTISFCDDPEKFYPTGSLNFSLIDQAELQIQVKTNINSTIRLHSFVKNFNIINIERGMVSLAFSS